MGISAAIRFFIFGLGLLGLAACSTFERQAAPVAKDTLVYVEESARARQEQLLLNIVRLRYNDPVSFVELDRLTSQDRSATSGNASTTFLLNGGSVAEFLNSSINQSSSTQPTAVYAPLRGKAYAQQLLQPLPPASIFLLSQSGWSVERLMLCCVARIGNVDNARSIAGPFPDTVPDNQQFRDLASMMREAQLKGGLLVQVINPEETEETGVVEPKVILKWTDDTEIGQRLASHLKDNWIAEVTPLPGGRFSAEITARGNVLGDFSVRGRSLMGIMSAMSTTVHVPADHKNIAPDAVGNIASAGGTCAAPDPWSHVTGGFFAVNTATEKPEDAAVAVLYRDNWFYVADECRGAKATLNLIDHLFALQAGISNGGDTLLLLGG